MSDVTPHRSVRITHSHTPKMTERKKSLFQGDIEALMKHRRLPVVDSASDSEDCDLGIISTLDSSSSDEMPDQNGPKTPEKNIWCKYQNFVCLLFKHVHSLTFQEGCQTGSTFYYWLTTYFTIQRLASQLAAEFSH